MKDHGMSLAISFSLKLKGDGGVDGDGLWSCISFIIVMEVCSKWGRTWREMDECGERLDEQDSFLILYNIVFL